MSAILAVCGSSFCAMVSDGRMVEEPILNNNPNVLTEQLPKLRKVNKNVIVGFAGDTLAATEIINSLDEYDVRYLTLEKIVKVLHEKAVTVESKPVGVRLIVGGRGRKGKFEIVTMGSQENYEPQVREAIEGAHLIEGACSHTQISPFLKEFVRPQAAQWKNLDDIAKTLDACIAEIAKNDHSVNTNFYRQLVR